LGSNESKKDFAIKLLALKKDYQNVNFEIVAAVKANLDEQKKILPHKDCLKHKRRFLICLHQVRFLSRMGAILDSIFGMFLVVILWGTTIINMAFGRKIIAWGDKETHFNALIASQSVGFSKKLDMMG